MNNIARKQRFLIIGVVPHRQYKEVTQQDFKETYELIQTLGIGEVVDMIQQKNESPDRATYIGRGKVYEVLERIQQEKIDIVVLNDIVKPRQKLQLQNTFYKVNKTIQVWDRVDLILHIFSLHAHTAEAKLQIELARMKHMGPRIYGMGQVLSQQGGGIGVRGIGETNVELMKRHWRDAMKEVQTRLDKLTATHEKQLERRREIGLATISIVGYTNAGKTSLFNRLSGKDKLTENALFATLDSSVGKIYLPRIHKEVFISDTIGFIKNLPLQLVKAFKSTLMESVHADMLLHVIDVSDPLMQEKISVVTSLLEELQVASKKKIYVFNKIDAADGINKQDLLTEYRNYDPVFISIRQNENIAMLEETIQRNIA